MREKVGPNVMAEVADAEDKHVSWRDKEEDSCFAEAGDAGRTQARADVVVWSADAGEMLEAAKKGFNAIA